MESDAVLMIPFVTTALTYFFLFLKDSVPCK